MEPLSDVEVRVLGALIEKQKTTPQYYPLTLNALVAACNQTSNRFPVTAFEGWEVEEALRTLRERNLIRIVHPSHGERSTKYRHVLDEALTLDEDRELGLMGVLLLRGAQTPGELKSRTERMAEFSDLGALEHTLERLASRVEPLEPLVVRLERAPGQKESRWAHLLGETVPSAPAPPAGLAAAEGAAPSNRVAELEAEVAWLRRAVTAMAAELGVDLPAEDEPPS